MGGEKSFANLNKSAYDTIEFLGIWERVYNPDFKPVEFDRFRLNMANSPQLVINMEA